jgi:cell volume regulation protein A
MSIDILLLVGAVVVVAGVVVAKIGDRIGLPALLLFLGLGVLMGLPSHGTSFTNPALDARHLFRGRRVVALGVCGHDQGLAIGTRQAAWRSA